MISAFRNSHRKEKEWPSRFPLVVGACGNCVDACAIHLRAVVDGGSVAVHPGSADLVHTCCVETLPCAARILVRMLRSTVSLAGETVLW